MTISAYKGRQGFFFELIERGWTADVFQSIEREADEENTGNTENTKNTEKAGERAGNSTQSAIGNRETGVAECQLVFLKLVNTYLRFHGNTCLPRSMDEFLARLLGEMCLQTIDVLKRHIQAADAQRVMDGVKNTAKAAEILISCVLCVSIGEVKEMLLKNNVVQNLIGMCPE